MPSQAIPSDMIAATPNRTSLLPTAPTRNHRTTSTKKRTNPIIRRFATFQTSRPVSPAITPPTRPLCPLGWRMLEPLDDRRVRQAPTLAHRLESEAGPAPLELEQQRGHQAGPRCAERVAEGD